MLCVIGNGTTFQCYWRNLQQLPPDIKSKMSSVEMPPPCMFALPLSIGSAKRPYRGMAGQSFWGRLPQRGCPELPSHFSPRSTFQSITFEPLTEHVWQAQQAEVRACSPGGADPHPMLQFPSPFSHDFVHLAHDSGTRSRGAHETPDCGSPSTGHYPH